MSTRSVQQAREGLPEKLRGGGFRGEEVRDVLFYAFRRLEGRLLRDLGRHSHVQDRTGAIIRDRQRVAADERSLEVEARPLVERIDEARIGRRLVFGVGPPVCSTSRR